MNHKFVSSLWWRRGLIPVIAIFTLLIVACGAAATATPPPTVSSSPDATTAPAVPQATAPPARPTATGPAPTSTPVPVVQPTIAPTQVQVSRDNLIVVINEEPSIPDPWLGTTLFPNQVVHNIAVPFSFFGPDFQDTPTGGFESFEIIDPSRWRLKLLPGVKFHDGTPWNAEAADWNIDTLGGSVEYNSYSNVRASHAEILDDLTVDFVCDENPCPALPRFAQFHLFVSPTYMQENSQEDRDASGRVVGFGPYAWKEWQRGQSYKVEQYEDYVEPQPVNFVSQKGTIKEASYIWRGEELVRAAMIQTGEADLVWAVSGDLAGPINNSEHGKTVKVVSGEVYTINVDTLWDPFLSDLRVRQALAHAIDCEAMALSLFGPESRCASGPNGIPGTLGVTEENAKPIYTYDPQRARELLAEAGYDPDHEINFWTRAGRYTKDVEVSESLGAFWAEVGLNVRIRIAEGSIWRENHLQGPGRITGPILKEGGTNAAAIAAVAGSEAPGPTFTSPGLIFFAPGGELFDFGRQLNFYASCFSNRAKNCNPERELRVSEALSAAGDERRVLMEAAYEDFAQNLLHIPLMEIVSVWGVNKDLDFVNQPGGRRILINGTHWTK